MNAHLLERWAEEDEDAEAAIAPYAQQADRRRDGNCALRAEAVKVHILYTMGAKCYKSLLHPGALFAEVQGLNARQKTAVMKPWQKQGTGKRKEKRQEEHPVHPRKG